MRRIFVIARARGQAQKQRAIPIVPQAARLSTRGPAEPRRCRWPWFAHHHWPTKVFGRPLPRRWMRPSRMFRSAALLLVGHSSRDSTGRLALEALKTCMSLTEAPAGSLTRCPLTSTPTTTISTPAGRAFPLPSKSSVQRLRCATIFPDPENCGSHVAHAVHAHVDCPPLHRSTTIEPSFARCKQSARPATRMTIGRHCMRRQPHDLLSWACRFHFRSSFNHVILTARGLLPVDPDNRAVPKPVGHSNCRKAIFVRASK
jgi:hypothetical protein